jgi:hypothetical protein
MIGGRLMPSCLKTLPVNQRPENQTVPRRSGWFVLEYPDVEDKRHRIHPGELAVLVGAKSMGTCLKLLREMLHLYDPRRFRHGLATAYQKPREAIRMTMLT